MDRNHVIRIECADRKGLIAGITAVLFRNNHNILVMKEFVEPETDRFFARLEVSGDPQPTKLTQELSSVLPERSVIQVIPKRKKAIVILVTKEHHCLADLLVRHCFDELHADVRAVIGNHDVLEAFTGRFGIPFHHIPFEETDRASFEAAIQAQVHPYAPDYIVLAKFMRILSANFVGQYPHRILNIHHSFLPAFKGANPYRKAYERGVKLIGATAHFVNEDLDEGPIITQKIIPVGHDDELSDMIEAGHEVEKSVLADALKLVIQDRVFVSGNKTIIFH